MSRPVQTTGGQDVLQRVRKVVAREFGPKARDEERIRSVVRAAVEAARCTCPFCDGAKVLHGMSCPRCKGRGWVLSRTSLLDAAGLLDDGGDGG